jgi:hypothetical protein
MTDNIFILWTGDNEMSENRKKAIQSMKTASPNITLITKGNLGDFLVKGHPLHASYEYLSDVHKSDYLRAYLMHFHGGGYSDVKTPTESWLEAFKTLNNDTHALGLGYTEVGRHGVALIDNKSLYQKMVLNHNKLIGCGAFIFKPNTIFTTEWLFSVENVLAVKHKPLKANRGNIMGDNKGYPLKWTEIMGNIFHPICFKYQERIIKDDRVKPDFSKVYR